MNLNLTQLLALTFSLLMTNAASSEQNSPIYFQQNIILKSDHSKLDGKTGIFEHCGNAVLTQQDLTLTADCLIGKKNKDGSYAFISAKGNPASLVQVNLNKQEKLTAEGQMIEYTVPTQYFLISKQASLKLTNAKRDDMGIIADKIELDNRQKLNRDISAAGSYLQIELIKSGKTELKAQAKKLHFNTASSKLKLSEDVTANLELGKITAGVFNYNSKTKISSFEKSSKEQIEIIQTKKPPQ